MENLLKISQSERIRQIFLIVNQKFAILMKMKVAKRINYQML